MASLTSRRRDFRHTGDLKSPDVPPIPPPHWRPPLHQEIARYRQFAELLRPQIVDSVTLIHEDRCAPEFFRVSKPLGVSELLSLVQQRPKTPMPGYLARLQGGCSDRAVAAA